MGYKYVQRVGQLATTLVQAAIFAAVVLLLTPGSGVGSAGSKIFRLRSGRLCCNTSML